MSTLVIRSRRVLIEGELCPAWIAVRNGVVTAIGGPEELGRTNDLCDFGDAVVMPGLVDTHVHINEPGRTDWEGFATATRAAAAGGVTTVIEMPLNSIPATTTVEAYRLKAAAAEGKLAVDVGFWGGVVPGNTAELPGLHEAGVFGFKCFLVPSGVPEFAADRLPVLGRRRRWLLCSSLCPAGSLGGGDPLAPGSAQPPRWLGGLGQVRLRARPHLSLRPALFQQARQLPARRSTHAATPLASGGCPCGTACSAVSGCTYHFERRNGGVDLVALRP